MLVSNTRYHARVATCRACEFFKPTTESCGTFMHRDIVTYQGEQRTLCGCKIRAKAWIAFFNCPLNKWKQKDRIVAILAAAKSFSNPPTQEEIDRFYKMKSDLIGKEVMPECEACARREIQQFIRDINIYLQTGEL